MTRSTPGRVSARRVCIVLVAVALLTPVASPAVADDGDVTVSVETPDSVDPGQGVTVTVTITNDNDHAISEDFTLFLRGEPIHEERSILVPAGETETVAVAFEAPAETGTYRLSVDSTRDMTGESLPVVEGPLQDVRVDAPENVTENETASLEFTTTVYGEVDRLDFEAAVTNATAVEVTRATVEGTGSVDRQGTDNGTVVVSGSGFEPVATLRVVVTVEAPADTSAVIDVTATANASDDVATTPVTLPVVERAPQSVYRSFEREIRPGGTTNVSTNVTVDGPELSINERVDGAANLSYVAVRTNNSDPYHVWAETNDEWMNLTLGGFTEPTTVTLVYEVGVPPNATTGDRIQISGNATTNDGVLDLEVSTIFVTSPSPLAPYAGDDGRIESPGLRRAISDWARGEIGIEMLQDVISAWASGERVTSSAG